MSPNFGGKPWSLIHHVCIKSAIQRIKPTQTYFYYEYEPKGAWWQLSREMLTLVKIGAPRSIFGNPVSDPAHRADIVRLEKLLEVGGIYLDCDVFVHRDFDDLLQHRTVLGAEGRSGLCNAVIIAEPQAPFLKKWYDEYASFRGRKGYWAEHSVQVPFQLAQKHPSEITLLPEDAFFWPTWDHDGLARIFGSATPISKGTYANHLWESQSWERYLENLTPARVRQFDTNFHFWARPMLEGLSNEYGLPPAMIRVLRKVRRAPSRPLLLGEKVLGRSVASFEKGLRRSVGSSVGRGLLSPIVPLIRDTRLARLHRRSTFQSVYRNRQWGTDGESQFFSGAGSRGVALRAYVESMAPVIASHIDDFGSTITLVDLGCGDFSVAAGLLERLPPLHYIGCDVVPELIAYNRKRHQFDNVEFRVLDIVSEELPPGDVCLIRQVFQHLSNRDISTILPKLRKYRHVYFTEGQPLACEGKVNPDKFTNANVRFNWRTGRGRGVELDKPPFNLIVEEVCRGAAPPPIKELTVTYRLHMSAVARSSRVPQLQGTRQAVDDLLPDSHPVEARDPGPVKPLVAADATRSGGPSQVQRMADETTTLRSTLPASKRQ